MEVRTLRDLSPAFENPTRSLNAFNNLLVFPAHECSVADTASVQLKLPTWSCLSPGLCMVVFYSFGSRKVAATLERGSATCGMAHGLSLEEPLSCQGLWLCLPYRSADRRHSYSRQGPEQREKFGKSRSNDWGVAKANTRESRHFLWSLICIIVKPSLSQRKVNNVCTCLWFQHVRHRHSSVHSHSRDMTIREGLHRIQVHIRHTGYTRTHTQGKGTHVMMKTEVNLPSNLP